MQKFSKLKDFLESLAQVFSHTIRRSQKFEAPLLGLARSIHYKGQAVFTNKIRIFSPEKFTNSLHKLKYCFSFRIP